eukprot:756524-Hanusia_phi.AAC.1
MGGVLQERQIESWDSDKLNVLIESGDTRWRNSRRRFWSAGDENGSIPPEPECARTSTEVAGQPCPLGDAAVQLVLIEVCARRSLQGAGGAGGVGVGGGLGFHGFGIVSSNAINLRQQLLHTPFLVIFAEHGARRTERGDKVLEQLLLPLHRVEREVRADSSSSSRQDRLTVGAVGPIARELSRLDQLIELPLGGEGSKLRGMSTVRRRDVLKAALLQVRNLFRLLHVVVVKAADERLDPALTGFASLGMPEAGKQQESGASANQLAAGGHQRSAGVVEDERQREAAGEEAHLFTSSAETTYGLQAHMLVRASTRLG